MGIVLAVIVWQSAKFCRVASSLEMAIHEDIAMIRFCVADPHESPITGDGAVVEKRRSAPQYRVSATVNAAVLPVATTIGLQGIAITDDVDVLKEVAFAVHQQSFCLSLAIRPDGQIAECQIAAIVGGKGGTT